MPDETHIPELVTKLMIRRLFLPIAERTFDRWVSDGTFPKPDMSIGGKVRFWRRETVTAWIESRSDGRTR